MDIAFEELVEAAQKLSPAQKSALLYRLNADSNLIVALTREQAIEELEALRAAGAFQKVESLHSAYARSDLHLDQDELDAYLQEIGKAWEQDIDDLSAGN